MFPTIYQNTYISLQTLWVFAVAAMLIGSYLAVKRLKRRRVNFTLIIEHSTSFLVSAVLGSRIVYFILNTDAYFPAFDFRTLFNFISIWDQGFSLWGGVLGMLSMLTYRIHKEKENIWKWFDALIVPGLLAFMIGNFGAFLGGYSYGNPTDLPWGVTYHIQNVRYTVPVHPTQIYAIIAISLLLWSKFKLKKKTQFFETDGNTSIYLTTGFSGIYCLLNFFRGDLMLMIFDIRLSMIVSGLLFIISSIYLYKRYRKYNESI
ncbi:hypothetical protein HOD30_04025 [Candidatus Peregrinibacteria bacterium]|jgi:phosphatidylglycerol---prolipoprotein diacylglyceryl transferase|nr:hypothetical protein [Candidatus Peregrinibacteria bacterium]MBT4632128.1 hypothetical protein [Candidatus Peregrinibacteria bacterium]